MTKYQIIIITLFLTACGQSPIPTDVSRPNQCRIDTDCQTPTDYLIRSNCPFKSACIENLCQVVCPIPHEEKETQCKTDSDCNCEQRGIASKNCICKSGECLSVETENE